MEVLGYRIKQARKEAGLTYEQLARLADVPLRQLFRWEAGTNQPRPANLAKIAKATKKTVDFFVVPLDGGVDAASRVEKVGMRMANDARRDRRFLERMEELA